VDQAEEYEHHLMVKTAWYYYIEDYTQQSISHLLGISRTRVIHLLEKARQSGVVRFAIQQEGDRRMRLERGLITRFGLKDAFVVPAEADTLENLNSSIARAAAMYIANRLGDNGFLNMGYGDTPSRVLNYLATMVEKPVNVVSLTGGVNYYLPKGFSRTFNARLYLLPAPLLLSGGELVDALRQESSVKEIRRMARLSQMSVVGVGGMSDGATIMQNGILTKTDFTLLGMQGAVGDILSHFLDKEGNPVDSSIEKRLMSTPLEDLRAMDNVIGAAGGAEKVEAILAVLKGKYLDALVTDQATAAALLERSGEQQPS
jgi:DNA-binding transcriptional regulator LsrR (DeoR family)